MVIVVILAVVLIFVPLALWGLNRVRESRPEADDSTDGRGSVNTIGILFVFVTLAFGIALPLILLYGNSNNSSKQVHGVKLTAAARSGRALFGQHCAVCHTLAAANAIGKVGPDLDTIHPVKALVLHTIANGCIPDATVKTENEACLGQGVMPAEVVTGQDAKDVAAFVAEAAESKRAIASAAAGSGSASASSGSSASTSTSGSGTSTSGSGTSTSSGGTSTSSSGGAASPAALKAGMKVFETAGCASCHTLAAAGSTGTVGPNLDQLKPSDALVIHQVTNGGGGMPAFGSSLSSAQIKSVALFVSSVAGKPVKGKVPKSSSGGGP